MTVAELIKKLQEMPSNLPVYLADREGYYGDSHMTEGDGPRVCAAEAYGARTGPELPERVTLGLDLR